MKQKILFDTSVWIEYFKNNNIDVTNLIDSLLLKDCVYINGIIIAELIQGLKTKKEEKNLSVLLSALHQLEITIPDWQFAGEISAVLRRKGITLPLTYIGIAANAIINNVTVFSFDKHFCSIDELDLKLL